MNDHQRAKKAARKRLKRLWKRADKALGIHAEKSEKPEHKICSGTKRQKGPSATYKGMGSTANCDVPTVGNAGRIEGRKLICTADQAGPYPKQIRAPKRPPIPIDLQPKPGKGIAESFVEEMAENVRRYNRKLGKPEDWGL